MDESDLPALQSRCRFEPPSPDGPEGILRHPANTALQSATFLRQKARTVREMRNKFPPAPGMCGDWKPPQMTPPCVWRVRTPSSFLRCRHKEGTESARPQRTVLPRQSHARTIAASSAGPVLLSETQKYSDSDPG